MLAELRAARPLTACEGPGEEGLAPPSVAKRGGQLHLQRWRSWLGLAVRHMRLAVGDGDPTRAVRGTVQVDEAVQVAEEVRRFAAMRAWFGLAHGVGAFVSVSWSPGGTRATICRPRLCAGQSSSWKHRTRCWCSCRNHGLHRHPAMARPSMTRAGSARFGRGQRCWWLLIVAPFEKVPARHVGMASMVWICACCRARFSTS